MKNEELLEWKDVLKKYIDNRESVEITYLLYRKQIVVKCNVLSFDNNILFIENIENSKKTYIKKPTILCIEEL